MLFVCFFKFTDNRIKKLKQKLIEKKKGQKITLLKPLLIIILVNYYVERKKYSTTSFFFYVVVGITLEFVESKGEMRLTESDKKPLDF